MTPQQWLNEDFPDEILLHEIGHEIIGLQLGLEEGGIELLRPNPYERAQAHSLNLNVPAKKLIVRGLAGMYCQALCAPKSIALSLRTAILTDIFQDTELDIEDPNPTIFRTNGFGGDWIRIVRAAKTLVTKNETAIQVIQSAQRDLASIAAECGLERAAVAVLKNMRAWLNTEDDDLRYTVNLIYSVNDIKSALTAAS